MSSLRAIRDLHKDPWLQESGTVARLLHLHLLQGYLSSHAALAMVQSSMEADITDLWAECNRIKENGGSQHFPTDLPPQLIEASKRVNIDYKILLDFPLKTLLDVQTTGALGRLDMNQKSHLDLDLQTRMDPTARDFLKRLKNESTSEERQVTLDMLQEYVLQRNDYYVLTLQEAFCLAQLLHDRDFRGNVDFSPDLVPQVTTTLGQLDISQGSLTGPTPQIKMDFASGRKDGQGVLNGHQGILNGHQEILSAQQEILSGRQESLNGQQGSSNGHQENSNGYQGNLNGQQGILSAQQEIFNGLRENFQKMFKH